MTRTILASMVLTATLAIPTVALAGKPEPLGLANPAASPSADRPIATAALRQAAAQNVVNLQRPGYPLATQSAGRKGRVARKVIGGVLGGVGGFFLGGVVGAKLEPDCGCDDPGLKGFLIGAPIGAAVGAVIGAMVD